MEQVLDEAPFRYAFSLDPLIEYWNNVLSHAGPYWAHETAEMAKALSRTPELHGPIEDMSVLDVHHELVAKLMSVVFAPASWETEPVGALVPFTLQPAYFSPEFRRLFVDDQGGYRGRLQVQWSDFARGRLIRFYLFLLRKFYGMERDLETPMVRITTDPTTGLERYFRFWPELRFLDARPIEPPKQLTDEERFAVLEHITEPHVLREILHPENFDVRGFTVVHAVDVTHSELMAALQKDLVEEGSMFANERFLSLQHRLRSIFRRPDLIVGLAAIQGDEFLLLNTGCVGGCNCIFADSTHVPITKFQGSLFDRAATSSQTLLVSDLARVPNRTPADEKFLHGGLRSLLVAPLYYQKDFIGVLSIGAPQPGELGATEQMLTGQILPLFALALKRALNELNNQVDSIIMEKCTAVHPSVEWRFRQAALAHLGRSAKGDGTEMEPIVFRDVYPLYAASDIRGSSEARNRAIQADLLEHLDLALGVLRSAEGTRSLPILGELAHRMTSHREQIETGLTTGDEIALLNFLKNEFEPLVPLLRGLGPAVGAEMQRYNDALDPAMGTVYRERRDFEQSMAAFNRKVSLYLDLEEAEAQSMFPHYFNKHQTDGVDYLMYVGASMVENAEFSELHVRNLRLWQLMVACGIAWHCQGLKENLKVPLDATHLVLVNNSRLSIRFRFDEKRFDVDGAYDIAHEIVRSRIDKAKVKGTSERLTQPDHVAIVYSRPDEADEMRGHVRFLQSQGFLHREVEELDLGDLPGVQGLKALRVGVNLASPELAERAARMM
jgi:hypothetical protein